MAIFTGTIQTFQSIGIREQLSDAIINISPTDTPFTSMVKKGTAKSRTPEWLRDRLRAPTALNITIEGDDVAAGSTTTQPTRLRNVVQLFSETVVVSDTARAVDTAGRSDDLKYHVAKAGEALKTDMEMRFLGNYPSVVGNTGAGGQCAGAEAWITTNDERNTGGSDGGFNTGTSLVAAATDGTQRAFTEALLKSAIKKAWDYGGKPTIVMMTGGKKQLASAFTGIATQMNELSAAQPKITILGAADVYRSDFGRHMLVPNRFQGAGIGRTVNSASLFDGRSVLILDPTLWEIKFLQPFAVTPLARTGHAEKRLLKAEATLVCKDEGGNAVVADLT